MMDRIQKWIEIARWAPSGGNSQPWSVSATSTGERIELRIGISQEYSNVPSPMDVQGAAAVMALGSFVHNLRSICMHDGFFVSRVDFDFRDSFWTSTVIVRIEPGNGAQEYIARPYSIEEIRSRRTDRGALKTVSLPRAFLDELAIIQKRYNVNLHQFTSETIPSKADLIRPLSMLERVRWRNPVLLTGLLKELGFRKQPESDKIPLSQLGVSRLDQALLRLFRNHPWSRIFLQTPMVEIPVYKSVNGFVEPCERVCFLSVNATTEWASPSVRLSIEFKQAFEMGECLQNIWLEADRHGISFQPLGLPLIVLGKHLDPTTLNLTEALESQVDAATQAMKKIGVDVSKLSIGFRLGETRQLAEKAQRRELWIEECSQNSSA